MILDKETLEVLEIAKSELDKEEEVYEIEATMNRIFGFEYDRFDDDDELCG